MKIQLQEITIEDITSVIIVPEKSLEEAGYIHTLTESNDASSKHEFHAMAQMAYYQYQDDELAIDKVVGEIKVQTDSAVESLLSGMLLYRDNSGGFHAVVHQGLNVKKLLEAAYRFCTRWVRLDI